MEIPATGMRIFRVFLFFSVLVALTATAESFKDEKYYEQDMTNQIANWLMQASRNRDRALCSTSASKRNSEIINSILGLPKNLNDVGKK